VGCFSLFINDYISLAQTCGRCGGFSGVCSIYRGYGGRGRTGVMKRSSPRSVFFHTYKFLKTLRTLRRILKKRRFSGLFRAGGSPPNPPQTLRNPPQRRFSGLLKDSRFVHRIAGVVKYPV